MKWHKLFLHSNSIFFCIYLKYLHLKKEKNNEWNCVLTFLSVTIGDGDAVDIYTSISFEMTLLLRSHYTSELGSWGGEFPPAFWLGGAFTSQLPTRWSVIPSPGIIMERSINLSCIDYFQFNHLMATFLFRKMRKHVRRTNDDRRVLLLQTHNAIMRSRSHCYQHLKRKLWWKNDFGELTQVCKTMRTQGFHRLVAPVLFSCPHSKVGCSSALQSDSVTGALFPPPYPQCLSALQLCILSTYLELKREIERERSIGDYIDDLVMWFVCFLNQTCIWNICK